MSSGFRVPNVDDLSKIFETAQGTVVVPNEDIEPEKTITGEIGITKIYNGKTSWENTLYYTGFLTRLSPMCSVIRGKIRLYMTVC
ncbi:MAG: TonB-dependent receptor [Bacteroidetes bacterium]|nr:TonB-dependent receptor [Bacteroidota bacterium]